MRRSCSYSLARCSVGWSELFEELYVAQINRNQAGNSAGTAGLMKSGNGDLTPVLASGCGIFDELLQPLESPACELPSFL